ncbi:hypothetical protein TKK_0013574 [Trichogramma kaykai]|uniref:HTH CENPB-type domain-containing protein n=1 Tax=Trichogramma kaykai TaxID=54128 RepID=A0ABD2WHU2_9HYME
MSAVRQKRVLYSKDVMERAVQEVKRGMPINAASIKYNLPRSTIHSKYNNIYCGDKPGAKTKLTTDEEATLVGWILYMCDVGYPVTKDHLINSVALLVKHKPRPHNFKGGRPGIKWYNGFLDRHGELSKRVSENLTLSRAQVTETSIRNWFTEVDSFIIKNNLTNISGSRVFNTDETALNFNPDGGPVLARKGSKNVYKVVGNNEKANLTTLVTANAAGQLAPTMIVYKYKRVPMEIYQKLPEDNFCVAGSDTGWMTAELFYEYIANIFLPWLKEKKIELPVIMYLDRHVSHLTEPLSKFCNANLIYLIGLPPNTTHFMQPMDVSMFGPLKAHWRKQVNIYRMAKTKLSVEKEDFAQELEKTFKTMDLVQISANGFRACGLYPLDANAVNYTEILTNKKKKEDTYVPISETSTDSQWAGTLKNIENFLEPEKLDIFKKSAALDKYVGSLEDTSLYYMWKNFYKATNSLKIHIL